MNALAAYLQSLDDVWQHDYESVRAALSGVSEEEASWQAACYRDEKTDSAWPAPGTIHWQVAHLADCKLYYAAIVAQLGHNPPAPEYNPSESFESEVAALESAHATWRAAVAALDGADFEQPAGSGMPLREFLAMAIRHDAWHASQIAVVRRMFRSR